MAVTAVLQSPAPSFTAEEATSVAAERFGISGVIRLLTSERDQNFHLRSADGREYVLKIANAAESPAIIAFQNDVLEHIARSYSDAPTPRVIRSLQEEGYFVERGSIVRMLSWIGGPLMYQVERTEGLRASLGTVHGRLASALGSYHAAPPEQDLLWDLQGFSRLESLLQHIDDSAARTMLAGVLDRFSAHAAPVLAELRTQVIHNDLNPHNVVVDRTGAVCGVIDFGDMVHAPLICDVAVAGAYHVRQDGAPLADVAQYVAAFHRQTPLTSEEINLLPLLIEARLAMSVLITNWRASLYPHNRAYVLRNAPASWDGLKALQSSSARLEFTP